jgi:outer membrane protein TolC
MEQIVKQRIQEGVDSPASRDQARLSTARAYLRLTEAQGAVDVLRNRLAQLTGLPAAAIEIVPDSIPSLPDTKQEDDLVSKAVQTSPAVQVAEARAQAVSFRARGEHRSLLPAVDFAAQYALLSRYNNYDEFYQRFERHNATVGVAIRFPFLSASQHARAKAADAEAVKASKDASTARNRVSEETLKLQRSVAQLAAAREVANLEYEIARSNVESTQVRVDSGGATLHDLDNARTQANERYSALQDADFELQRARIALLRATGELEGWLGLTK